MTTSMVVEQAGHASAHHAHRPPWAFFASGGKGYAVPLDRVHEIVPPQPLTRLPGCGPEVCGLAGLRGRVITVFDLGVLSGEAPSAGRSSHRLILFWRGDRVIGLAVDEVVTIGPPDPETDDATDAPDATLRANGRSFTILDPDRLFGPLLA